MNKKITYGLLMKAFSAVLTPYLIDFHINVTKRD